VIFAFNRAFPILRFVGTVVGVATVLVACEVDTNERRFPRADVLASIFSLVENTGLTLE